MTTAAMDEAVVVNYITTTFPDCHTITANGNYFFLDDPASKLTFATLVTTDEYDQASNLDRPAVYRLNIGVGKDIFQSLFGPAPSAPDGAGYVNTGHDFTTLDQLMPHPVYGHMYWLCVLSPSAATFQTVQPYLAEAHRLAARRTAKRPVRD